MMHIIALEIFQKFNNFALFTLACNSIH